MNPPAHDILRIIDTSLNRIGEGLRVLEEYARFSLNDAALTQTLKNLRHRLVRIDPALQAKLLNGRDSQGDVGADMEVPGETKARDTSGMIAANARRVQESLRVMEEITRAPELGLDSNSYKQARFELYTIEKELLGKMLRQNKLKKLAGLYVIIDVAFLKGRNLAYVANQAIRGGATTIQLRDKERGAKDIIGAALELRKVCAEHNILFIVNDSLEATLASDADGLHVGQEDLPVDVARRLLPFDKILGVSVSTTEEAAKAYTDGANYLGAGAIFPTATKEVTGITGVELVKEIKKNVPLPLVAIGGINKDNLQAVLRAGADNAAVISAVMGAGDIEKATRQLADIIEGERNG